ncbi:reverse transcriptase domain-containing protein [Tanacetum coccineum]
MKTINKNQKEWADKLDDALWEFKTAYKSPIGSTPFRIIYGKACHLPIEMEHKAYWALKNANLDLDVAGRNRFLQLNKLAEMRNEACSFFEYLHYELPEDFVSIIFGIILELQHDDFPV